MCIEICAYLGKPIGPVLYNKIFNEYKEWFPEENEERRKWDSVPKEVKDKYYDELFDIQNELKKDLPNSGKGIWYWATHPKEHAEYDTAYSKIYPTLKKSEESLYNEYFGKYGLKYNRP